ncbi:MAG: YceD family protein [Pyrinomonadaceae bacterium]
MQVELASLERHGGKFAHNYRPGELDLNEERVTLMAPPRVTGRVQQSDSKVTVKGEAAAELQLECDRCLKPLSVPVFSSFEVGYVTPDTYQADSAAELLDEDLSLSVFNGEVLDIDELVREQLLLELPAQILCQQECKGLCQECGGDRNDADCKCEDAQIDPRWAGLKEIGNRKS